MTRPRPPSRYRTLRRRGLSVSEARRAIRCGFSVKAAVAAIDAARAEARGILARAEVGL